MPHTRAAASTGARAMHKAHPKGRSTAAQANADRNNLIQARAAQKTGGGPRTAAQKVWVQKGEAGWKRAGAINWALGESAWTKKVVVPVHRGHITAAKHPLGTHIMSHSMSPLLPRPRNITGVPRKIPSRVAPGSYDSSVWRQSRAHRISKRVHLRKPRHKTIKGFKHRKHRTTAR